MNFSIENAMVACCSDGTQPLLSKIEGIDYEQNQALSEKALGVE